MNARIFRTGNPGARAMLAPVLERLPVLEGSPIRLVFRAGLTAAGIPVHAGSDLRRRRMILDRELLHDTEDLLRIFVHEAHHFVWARLGNTRRFEYEAVVGREMEAGARGELGWSAKRLKASLAPEDRIFRTRRWRLYVCESYCDTAAWLYAGLDGHDEWTLAARHRKKRAECLTERIIKSGEPLKC